MLHTSYAGEAPDGTSTGPAGNHCVNAVELAVCEVQDKTFTSKRNTKRIKANCFFCPFKGAFLGLPKGVLDVVWV